MRASKWPKWRVDKHKLEKEYVFEERNVPVGLLRGIDQPIPTAGRTGNAIYGRTDMPDDFAHTLT
jgi:hypothetical protein